MTDWGRIQRIELELAQAYGRVMRLTEERDTARRVAVRLGGENAELLAARAQAAYDAAEPPDPHDDEAYEAGWTDALAQALAVVDKGGRAEQAIRDLIAASS